MRKLNDFLNTLDNLTNSYNGKNGEGVDYISPSYKHMGSVTVVRLVEVIAPTIFRNSEEEMTSTTIRDNFETVCGKAYKTKYVDSLNGLRILRTLKAGGNYPKNRHTVAKNVELKDVFDLNSMVFGDSAFKDGRVLPVKSGTNYSDLIGLSHYMDSVDKSLHIKNNEEGTLFDYENKKNASSIYDRHFIKPGTLFVQSLTINGKTLPIEGLNHLLLSIGISGSYGGSTAVTGTNLKSHLVGIYGNTFERPEMSPYEIANHIYENNLLGSDAATIINAINEYVSPHQEVRISHEEASKMRDQLMNKLIHNRPEIEKEYKNIQHKVQGLFEATFK